MSSPHLEQYDSLGQKVIAIALATPDKDYESAPHKHNKGQLILAIKGVISCSTSHGLWLVPPNCAVWIPKETWHSNKISLGGQSHFLLIDASETLMPKHTCTVKISPLLKELIIHLSAQSTESKANASSHRLIEVLLDLLASMEKGNLHWPVPNEPRLKKLSQHLFERHLLNAQEDKINLASLAKYLAMSERTLERLILKETAMTYHQWHSQLKIMMALSKLSDGLSVERIAYELGYQSVSAFIAMFKRHLGTTPAQYFLTQQ